MTDRERELGEKMESLGLHRPIQALHINLISRGILQRLGVTGTGFLIGVG